MKKVYPVILSLFVLMLCSACFRQSEWARIAHWDEFDLQTLATPDEFREHGAVIILDEGKVEVPDGENYFVTEYEHHRLIKILNQSGFAYANVSIPYNQSAKITSLRARTIAPDGKITVVDADKIFDITLYPRFIFFSDQRAKILTFPGVEENCLIELRYKMTIKNQTLVHSWSFQDYIPTLISRFSLRLPSFLDIEHKLYNTSIETARDETSHATKTTYLWEGRNLAAIEPEIAMPSAKHIAARLTLSPLGFNTWADVATWYHELSGPQMKSNPEIDQLVAQLTAEKSTSEDKLREIYDWVRDQIRYVAVEIGIGGFKPHSAAEVFKNRYGDCKDMTTLLCAMARSAGIEMNQALISTMQNGVADTSLCSPFHFNHVIAHCPSLGDSGLWLDATKKGTPFGTTAWYNQGIQAFVIDRDGKGKFIKTDRDQPSQNFHRLEWQVTIDSSGSGIVQGRSVFGGALAGEIRQDFFYAGERIQRKWIEAYLTQHCPLDQLDSFAISGLQPFTDPLVIEYAFRTQDLVRFENEQIILQPASILRTELPDLFYSAERRNPIQLSYGFKKDCTIDFLVPKDWQLLSKKKWNLINSDYGYYTYKIQAQEGSLQYQGSFVMEDTWIRPQNYTDFKNFMDRIRQNEQQFLLMDRKNR